MSRAHGQDVYALERERWKKQQREEQEKERKQFTRLATRYIKGVMKEMLEAGICLTCSIKDAASSKIGYDLANSKQAHFDLELPSTFFLCFWEESDILRLWVDDKGAAKLSVHDRQARHVESKIASCFDSRVHYERCCIPLGPWETPLPPQEVAKQLADMLVKLNVIKKGSKVYKKPSIVRRVLLAMDWSR